MLKLTRFFFLIFSTLMLLNSCVHDPVNPKGNIAPTPTPTKCNPDTVYFINTILPIIQSNCAMNGCHGNGSSIDGIELSHYNNIIKYGEIKSGNPNNSKLYEVITESKDKDVMPPPPSSRLNSDQINAIKKWIEQGAKYNYCTSGCDSTKFSYSADIKSIISNNCLGCHNSNNVKIGTYSELKTQIDNGKIWGAINHFNGFLPMPSSNTKLTDCEIQKFQKWIAIGAPNN
jgi:mono/diheme cytochrome c family protein